MILGRISRLWWLGKSFVANNNLLPIVGSTGGDGGPHLAKSRLCPRKAGMFPSVTVPSDTHTAPLAVDSDKNISIFSRTEPDDDFAG
jgi:hypothetical protein